MSVYEFTTTSHITNQSGKDLCVTYSFDVDEDGATLWSAEVAGLELISWIDDRDRESLETECLERMAADKRDDAVYRAEAAEISKD